MKLTMLMLLVAGLVLLPVMAAAQETLDHHLQAAARFAEHARELDQRATRLMIQGRELTPLEIAQGEKWRHQAEMLGRAAGLCKSLHAEHRQPSAEEMHLLEQATAILAGRADAARPGDPLELKRVEGAPATTAKAGPVPSAHLSEAARAKLDKMELKMRRLQAEAELAELKAKQARLECELWRVKMAVLKLESMIDGFDDGEEKKDKAEKKAEKQEKKRVGAEGEK